MFNNIAKQQIILDTNIVNSNDVSIDKSIAISGKNYYSVEFKNDDLFRIKLYFRVKYKKTKAAVSKDKIPFEEIIKSIGLDRDNVIDLEDIIDHRFYTHINFGLYSNEYIIYFGFKVEDELYEGYLIFNDPIDKDTKAKFNSYELKLVKYLKKLTV